MSAEGKLTFDPTFVSFAGTSLGQPAMIVFGVLVVSNEYSTGMIRTSLAAVPQRGTFLFSTPGVLRAVIGGGLYMTLIALFSMGVAAMLRSPRLARDA